VRRHPSEGIFGVQLAGNKPATLVPAAEAIARQCGPNIDFVDLNCGCPIDLIFKSGSGSGRKSHVDVAPVSWRLRSCGVGNGGLALLQGHRFALAFFVYFTSSPLPADQLPAPPVLDAPRKLGKILLGMNKALGEVPVTIKLRTGVKDGRNIAHRLMPRIASEWGVGCMTVSNICIYQEPSTREVSQVPFVSRRTSCSIDD